MSKPVPVSKQCPCIHTQQNTSRLLTLHWSLSQLWALLRLAVQVAKSVSYKMANENNACTLPKLAESVPVFYAVNNIDSKADKTDGEHTMHGTVIAAFQMARRQYIAMHWPAGHTAVASFTRLSGHSPIRRLSASVKRVGWAMQQSTNQQVSLHLRQVNWHWRGTSTRRHCMACKSLRSEVWKHLESATQPLLTYNNKAKYSSLRQSSVWTDDIDRLWVVRRARTWWHSDDHTNITLVPILTSDETKDIQL